MGGIVQLGRALEPFNLYWLEVEGFDPDALLEAKRHLLYTPMSVKEIASP